MDLHAILLTLFGWPAGIVLGNLLASLVWIPIQWIGIHIKLAAHHEHVDAMLDAQLQAIMRCLVHCPACGHPRSAADLLPPHDGPSITS